jgi:nucleoside-diphosphate-sugar epimerase
MRVLVTGGTGFVGAYSTKAIVDAGYDVRLLVRDPARIDSNVKPLGVHIDDYVVGDMTDERAVGAAMDGCDAVLHSAAVIDLGRRRAAEVLATNTAGVHTIMKCALDRRLDPIVYVSSVSALFAPGVGKLHIDLPPADVATPYGQSKSRAEAFVRELQADGAPIVTTYPGGVLAAPAGGATGELVEPITIEMKTGALPMNDGAWSIIDARDLGAIHAAALQPGLGPRRYMCGGHFLTWKETAAIYRNVTGRRFRVLPLPGAWWRGIGRGLDALRRVVPFETAFTAEAMEFSTQWVRTDDNFFEDLRVNLRDPRETFAHTIRAYFEAGLISARQAGPLLSTSTAR